MDQGKTSETGWYPKSEDELRFYLKHLIQKVRKSDPAKDDKLFNASNIKFYNRKKSNHGYNPGEDRGVYESAEQIDEDEKKQKQIDSLKAYQKSFGGNSSHVKMKRVAINRKIEKLEREISGAPTNESIRYKTPGRIDSIDDMYDKRDEDQRKKQAEIDAKAKENKAPKIHTTADKKPSSARRPVRGVRSGGVLMNGDEEQIDELKTKTLDSYTDKALDSRGKTLGKNTKDADKTWSKRTKGLVAARERKLGLRWNKNKQEFADYKAEELQLEVSLSKLADVVKSAKKDKNKQDAMITMLKHRRDMEGKNEFDDKRMDKAQRKVKNHGNALERARRRGVEVNSTQAPEGAPLEEKCGDTKKKKKSLKEVLGEVSLGKLASDYKNWESQDHDILIDHLQRTIDHIRSGKAGNFDTQLAIQHARRLHNTVGTPELSNADKLKRQNNWNKLHNSVEIEDEPLEEKDLNTVRVKYAKTYMKHAKTAKDIRSAQRRAYKDIKLQYGPELVKDLKTFHKTEAGQHGTAFNGKK